MDALALLCTLHADGPSTLKNLRQAGCGSLEALESMEEESLSRVLGGPPAVARRFVREARHLRERLDPGMIDREETHVDPPTDAVGLAVASGASGPAAPPEAFDLAARLGLSNLAPASRARDRTASSDLVAAVEGADPAAVSGASRLDSSAAPVHAHRDPMADVLEAWRQRDEVEACEPAVSAPVERIDALEDDVPPRPVCARPEFEFGAEIVAVMREFTSTITPEGPITSAPPEGSVSSRPAHEPLVEGLSALFEGQGIDLALRLGQEGIRDLRELTDADILALSERLGFGYTRILRVVQLARRAATGSPEPSAAVFGAGVADVLGAEGLVETSDAPAELESTPKLSPADRPRSQRPSILELEWNLEIQPQAPPRGHALSDATIPDARREGAGGPFA